MQKNRSFQIALEILSDEAQDLLNINPDARDQLQERYQQGYNCMLPLQGKVGASELGLHCKVADKRGLVAFANETRTFAYVLIEDGTVIGGAFHELGGGHFSLS